MGQDVLFLEVHRLVKSDQLVNFLVYLTRQISFVSLEEGCGYDNPVARVAFVSLSKERSSCSVSPLRHGQPLLTARVQATCLAWGRVNPQDYKPMNYWICVSNARRDGSQAYAVPPSIF